MTGLDRTRIAPRRSLQSQPKDLTRPFETAELPSPVIAWPRGLLATQGYLPADQSSTSGAARDYMPGRREYIAKVITRIRELHPLPKANSHVPHLS